uniref:WGS project CCBQ000000000 data, contig 00015 n=1 Tax=Syphacia muris TaxID=451379 RepID=A0A0N5AVI1_9BILA
MKFSLLPLSRVQARALSFSISRRSNTQSQKDDLSLFRQINKLAQEGRWNGVTNAPSFKSLFNSEAMDAFRKLNASKKYPFLTATDYGQAIKGIVALSSVVGAIYFGVYVYNWLVPEEKRLKYKYRHEQH